MLNQIKEVSDMIINPSLSLDMQCILGQQIQSQQNRCVIGGDRSLGVEENGGWQQEK